MKSIKFKHKNFKKVKIISNTSKREIIFNINNNFLLILKIIFLVFFISMDILILKSHFGSIEQSQDKLPEIASYLNGYYITSMEIQEFREYGRVNKFMEDNPKFEKSKNPIISVIVTIYNQAHCLHKCIKSIQNQSIKNIEILIIDDCSTDNTTDIIQQLQQIDPRIILYTHDTNEGVMKTKSEGIIKAKGEYITLIDGYDSFAHKDILKHSLYIAQLANLDIVEFQIGDFSDKRLKSIVNDYSMINLTNIIYQPELSTKFFVISDNEGIRGIQNRYIYSKIIKNDILKKVLKYIGPKYTDDFILEYEDVILDFSLLQLSQSYYYMKEIGYYKPKKQSGNEYPKMPNKICKPNNIEMKDMDHVKLMHFLYNNAKDNDLERQMVYHEIISIHHYIRLVDSTNHHYEFIYDILNKMINCPFLSTRQKQRLMSIKTRIEQKQNKAK